MRQRFALLLAFHIALGCHPGFLRKENRNHFSNVEELEDEMGGEKALVGALMAFNIHVDSPVHKGIGYSTTIAPALALVNSQSRIAGLRWIYF